MLQLLTRLRGIKLKRHLALRTYYSTAGVASLCTVKVGDAIPVNYLKDEKPPHILDDDAYPEWLRRIGMKEPTKMELLEKFHTAEAACVDGDISEILSLRDAKRLKRLLTLDTIRDNNAAAYADKS